MSVAAEAALVLGLISAAITAIDATKKLYDAAHDAKGLPEAFREVGERLPIVHDILQKAEEQVDNGKVKEATCKAVELVVKQCKQKAEKLRDLFNRVLPGEDAGIAERYKKAFKVLGKGNRVEELMAGIMDEVQLLAANRSMGAATDEQFQQLLDAIDKIKELEPSLPVDPDSVNISHTGSGHNIVATGSSTQPVNLGSGPQNTYTAPVTQHYGGDFAFYQPNKIAEIIEHLHISSDRKNEPSRIYKMLPARNETFVARDIIDEEVKKLLPFDKSGSIAICGLGGCGKTQIALDYAYRRHEATNCSMFWIRGDSRDLFTGSYEGVAKEANLPETLTGNDKLLAVRKWIESQHSWLVVVDNADDLDNSRSQYLEYVPRPQSCSNGATGAVIWTTRDSRIVYLPYGINEPIDASVMQRSESLLLHRKLLRRAKLSTSVDCVKPASEDEEALLDQLGDLPLAVSQAAAFIRRNGNIKRYVNRLRNSEAEAWDLLSREQLDPYRHARQNSVMKTWIVSLTRLKEEEVHLEEEAAEEEVGINTLQILYAVAFLDNQGITLELLQYSVGTEVHEDDLQEAVARLVDYSFLQYQGDIEEGSQTYSQHRLVSMAMRHYLNSKGSRSIHAERAFNIVLRCFPTEDHETADRCGVYLPHALRILTETGCSHFQQLADQLLPYLAFSYTCHGRYHEAQKTLEQLIALQDQLLGCSAARKLEAQSALGWTLILQGEFEDAMSILTSTLDSQKLILETNHPSIWMTTTNLARAAQKIGQYDKAEELQLAVLEYHMQQSGPTGLDTLGAMNNLALTYRYQGRFVEAETILKYILLEWKQSDLTRPLLALGAQNNLGLVFRAQNKLDEAEELLGKTIEEYTTRLGDSHPDTITSMDSLFHVYITQRRFNMARNIGSKVKNLSRTVLGDKHPLFLSASKELDTLQEMTAFPLRDDVVGEINIGHISNVGWTRLDRQFATNDYNGQQTIRPTYSVNTVSNVAFGGQTYNLYAGASAAASKEASKKYRPPR